MKQEKDRWEQPVRTVAREDVTTLNQDLTVQQALDAVRQRGVGEKIVYFYVVNDREELTGVVPTRRLLSAPLDQRLSAIMVRRVMSVPETATVLEACEAFVLHNSLRYRWSIIDAELLAWWTSAC
jgi:magnesium transporter